MGQPITLYKDGRILIVYGRHQANIHISKGWNEEEAAVTLIPAAASSAVPRLVIVLTNIPKNTLSLLIDNGYETLDQLAKAKPSDLTKIKGIGKKTAEKYIAAANEALQ